MAPSVWVLAACWLPAVTTRCLHMAGRRLQPEGADLQGFAADLALAALVAAVASWVPGRRVLALLSVSILTLFEYADYVHLETLGAPLALSQAGYLLDPTFLTGSALPAAASPLLAALLITALGLGWMGTRRPARGKEAVVLGVMGGVLAVSVLAWPRNPALPAWRQSHFLVESLRFRTDGPAVEGAGPVHWQSSDLEGEPRVALGQRHNVVLLILEGVSAGHLETQPGDGGGSWMPELARVARENLSWRAFVSPQRQTNRGEYALLCGDPPTLVTAEPKMSQAVRHRLKRLPCLPHALASAGYVTAYQQAAPLPFMLKDQFLPIAGFQRLYGEEGFAHAYQRNQWGIDDRAFLEASVSLIEELRREGQPWFLTLLTVGTHHPHNPPRDFRGRHSPGSFPWALEYLDLAVGEFVRTFEARGWRRDTLLLITSDESNLTLPQAHAASQLLAQGWGLLVGLMPAGEALVVDEPFVQTDLPLSVLDYLGLEDEAATFPGRSFFRRYGSPRPLALGNVYLRQVAALDSGRLLVCSEDLSDCQAWSRSSGNPFLASLGTPVSSPLDLLSYLRRAVSASLTLRGTLGSESGPGEATEMELMESQRLPVIEVDGRQLVFAGQFLSAPRGSTVEVDVELRMEGQVDDQGRPPRLWLSHSFFSRQAKHLDRGVLLDPGQRARLRYTVGARQDLDRIEIRLWVLQFQGREVELLVERALARFVPEVAGSQDTPEALRIHELAVVPDPAPAGSDSP